VYVYVAYRSQQPDGETEQEVMQKLQDNNIDASQFVEYSTAYCQ
jgi:uroporphyrinogen-III synthase